MTAACGAISQPISFAEGAIFPTDQEGLKNAGAKCGIKVGIQAVRHQLQSLEFVQVVKDNFNLMTPGEELKWPPLRPGPDSFDFTVADWMVDFCQRNDIVVHGHNLCWNAPFAYPVWFKSTLNPSNAKRFLAEHITTVVKRYAGRVSSWDVVNEPVVPWSNRPGGLYPGVWTDYVGPEYFDIAFHAAADTDPNALRILNIYNVEQESAGDEKTRKDTLELLKQLIGRRVPIQAVGVESHLDDAQPLGGERFRQFLNDIRALDLRVVITELDVQENRVGPPKNWYETAAKCYGDYLSEFISTADPPFVIFWSLLDRWQGGKRVQGLLQSNLSPSSNYPAAMNALKQAPSCG